MYGRNGTPTDAVNKCINRDGDNPTLVARAGNETASASASLCGSVFRITLTGLFELTGAIGLLVPSTAAASSYGLMALLVAMFPANVHAAREGLVIAGDGRVH